MKSKSYAKNARYIRFTEKEAKLVVRAIDIARVAVAQVSTTLAVVDGLGVNNDHDQNLNQMMRELKELSARLSPKSKV